MTRHGWPSNCTRVDVLDDLKFPPRCASRFQQQTMLARGGFGSVWRAWQTELDRPVAIKLLGREMLSDAQMVARFRDEARIAAALAHPNIVKVLDHDVEDEAPWIAFELVTGPSVAELLASGPLPPARALEVAVQVCAALEELHAHGVLHRDVKSSNVLQAGPDLFKLTDFGVARWELSSHAKTGVGLILGTPGCLAPELLGDAPPSPRTDVYALGILLFEMLAGGLPYTGSVIEVMAQHRAGIVPAPSARAPGMSQSLDRLVRSMMATDPEERPQSAAELKTALGAERSRLSKGGAARGRRSTPTVVTPQEAPPPGRERGTRPARVQRGRRHGRDLSDRMMAVCVIAAIAFLTGVLRTGRTPAGAAGSAGATPRAVASAARATLAAVDSLRDRLDGLIHLRQQRTKDYDQLFDITLGLEHDLAGAVQAARQHEELARADLDGLIRVTTLLEEAADAAGAAGPRTTAGPEPAYLLAKAEAEICVMHLRIQRVRALASEAQRIARATGPGSLPVMLATQAGAAMPRTFAGAPHVHRFLRASGLASARLLGSWRPPDDPEDAAAAAQILSQLYWVGEVLSAFSLDARLQLELASAVRSELVVPVARRAPSAREQRFAEVAGASFRLGLVRDLSSYRTQLGALTADLEALACARPAWTAALQSVLDCYHRDGPGRLGNAPRLVCDRAERAIVPPVMGDER